MKTSQRNAGQVSVLLSTVKFHDLTSAGVVAETLYTDRTPGSVAQTTTHGVVPLAKYPLYTV
jgi:hypothetical protein